jgi:hypothetical protein
MTSPQSSELETTATAQRDRPSLSRTGGHLAPCRCRSEIADLSDEQIESMSDEELIDLARASEHPWPDAALNPHLKYADRPMLLRLAFLVRNCCRNAESARREQALVDQVDGPQNRRDAGTLFGSPR